MGMHYLEVPLGIDVVRGRHREYAARRAYTYICPTYEDFAEIEAIPRSCLWSGLYMSQFWNIQVVMHMTALRLLL